MHHEEDAKVSLSKDSLAAHTFVTGSTGSGKTNTVCKILAEASNSGAGFLVIEPAKGEYKDVFG
jgi:DNA helicase HerA-like ATPase